MKISWSVKTTDYRDRMRQFERFVTVAVGAIVFLSCMSLGKILLFLSNIINIHFELFRYQITKSDGILLANIRD